MTKADTSPPEWRRRAALVVSASSVRFPPPRQTEQDASGGWVGPSGRVELGASALGGWDSLEQGEDDVAGRAAALCRRFAWEQPDDAPGLLVGWQDNAVAEPLARAHASAQPYGDIGAGVAFLARCFEEGGDVDDLDAAVELHDLAIAMGEGVWQPSNALVGWGGALLYAVTGEDAFLATTERMADVLCEAQSPDGSWADDDLLTELCARTLIAMADAVETRAAVEETLSAGDE